MFVDLSKKDIDFLNDWLKSDCDSLRKTLEEYEEDEEYEDAKTILENIKAIYEILIKLNVIKTN